MTTKRERALSSPSHAYSYLNELAHKLKEAQRELQDFLWDCHEDEDLWEAMTYEKMAIALRVSRQAVQQRVLRLLDAGAADREADDFAAAHEQLPFED